MDQFLKSNSNTRADAHGGSAGNRVRFVGDVVEAVLGHQGPARVRSASKGTVAIDHIGRDREDEDAEYAVEHVLARGQPCREPHSKNAPTTPHSAAPPNMPFACMTDEIGVGVDRDG